MKPFLLHLNGSTAGPSPEVRDHESCGISTPLLSFAALASGWSACVCSIGETYL